MMPATERREPGNWAPLLLFILGLLLSVDYQHFVFS